MSAIGQTNVKPLANAPRQEQVLDFIARNPGTTMNDVFHGLRSRVQGVTYESIRSALIKLLKADRIEKSAECDMYLSPLYVKSEEFRVDRLERFPSIVVAAAQGFEVERPTLDGYLVKKATPAGFIFAIAEHDAGNQRRAPRELVVPPAQPIKGRRIA